MILGFISLLLTFGQSYIARICISEKLSETMLPCALIKENEEHGEITPPAKNDHPSAEENHHRRLLWDDYFTNLSVHRRVLSGHVAVHCKEVSQHLCCYIILINRMSCLIKGGVWIVLSSFISRTVVVGTKCSSQA